MNKHLIKLSEDRGIQYEIIKSHNIIYNASSYCVSIPLVDEYGITLGYVEYRPDSKDLRYKTCEKEGITKPIIFGASKLRNAFYGKPVFVTEGIFDALTIEKQGYIAVAILGASRYKEKVDNMLKRYTDKVVIAFDNDVPGQKVSKKLQEKFNVYNFILKGSKDANDLIKIGKEDYLKKQLKEFVDKL